MKTEKVNELARKHAYFTLGKEQFKKNKDAAKSIQDDFVAGFSAAEDFYLLGANSGIQKIADERKDHFEKHFRTISDDWTNNSKDQLSKAAAILCEKELMFVEVPPGWDSPLFMNMCQKPWEERLVIAASLIAAELDVIQFKKLFEKQHGFSEANWGPLKVFKIEHGETTLVCHFTSKSAELLFLEEMPAERDDIESITEVPASEWEEMRILDTEGELNDDGKYPILQSVKEYMCTAMHPDIISTTDL